MADATGASASASEYFGKVQGLSVIVIPLGEVVMETSSTDGVIDTLLLLAGNSWSNNSRRTIRLEEGGEGTATRRGLARNCVRSCKRRTVLRNDATGFPMSPTTHLHFYLCTNN